MRINLERNEYNTTTELVFYENVVSLFLSFRQYHLSSSVNEQHKKTKRIDYLIRIVDDVDQFDRPKKRKKI